MAGRDHYQRAFEAYIRRRRLPYVSVDEARRALLPDGGTLKVHTPASLVPPTHGSPANGTLGHPPSSTAPPAPPGHTLKSFDFVVYGASNLLVEVKGRKVARRRPLAATNNPPARRSRPGDDLAPPPRLRLESWVTQDDVESLEIWEALFGPGFEAVFAFVYWCQEMPASALFEEFIEHDGRWYAIRCITRSDYRTNMRVRSARWRTVHMPPAAFDRLSRPLAGPNQPEPRR